MRIEMLGVAQLARELDQFPQVLAKKYLARATYTAAAVIEADAIARAPVRTGELKAHIAIFKRTSSPTSADYRIGVRGIKLNRAGKRLASALRRALGVRRINIAGDYYYWRFLEFGTSKMAARPFLRPAFEAQKANAVEVFKTILADGVQAAAAEVKGK